MVLVECYYVCTVLGRTISLKLLRFISRIITRSHTSQLLFCTYCTYLHQRYVLYLTTVQLFPAKIVLSPTFDRRANNSFSVTK